MDKDRLLGIMTRKERERDQVEIKIDRCVKGITYSCYPAYGIESINADATLQAAQELKKLCGEWEALGERIKELRAEVGL